MKLQQKKKEYRYLYKKDDEVKGTNITDVNEGIIEYGDDFINCKIIHDKDSTLIYQPSFLEMLSLKSIFYDVSNEI